MNIVNGFSGTPTQNELLKFYSLYKQATVGDNTRPKPNILNMKDRYKWDAWEKLKGMSQEDAEQEYIRYADELAEVYSSKSI